VSGPRIIIAPDSFKGALSANEAADALATGLRAALPDADLISLPMADGGEGTRAIIVDKCEGLLRTVRATDPLGRPVDVTVGLIDDATTAVIELAEVSGYQLLSDDERDPLRATTFGLGLVMRAALDAGVEKIMLCLGGSATVDGGAGMMQALGLQLVDCKGNVLPEGVGGGQLIDVERLQWHDPPEALATTPIEILCDVLNVATGPQGAARVFGPQKGADAAAVERLEKGMQHWVSKLEHLTGLGVVQQPGTGAAGGVALPLLSFCNAELVPGVDVVARLVGLNEHATDTDLIITGEGRLDGQSMMGKVVGAVARAAQAAHVPCVAVVGQLGEGHEAAAALLDRVFALECELSETAEHLKLHGQKVAAQCL